MVRATLEIVFIIGALCGLGYYILCLWSIFNFRHSNDQSEGGRDSFCPPVSILKPLKGRDREIYSCFRSHCLQNYGEYEIIFGVSEIDDEAVPLVKQLIAEFPRHNIRLVVCPEVLGPNRKAGNLAQMLPHARYDFVLVNDSDIRVTPGYLKNVLAPFADKTVGMVTTPYRGVAAGTLGSRLEAIGIGTDFLPGVLAARQVDGGLHFALGSTLAMRRHVLEQIGGFHAVADYLADDFELGMRVSKAGHKVLLSSEVVDTFLPAYNFSTFFAHQVRWARSTRDARKWGYAGIGLTFGIPWALLAVLAAGGASWSWTALIAVSAVRFAMALSVGVGMINDRELLKYLWLVPLRDVIALAIWMWSFVGDTIVWRGEEFLLKDGKLYPLRALVPTPEPNFSVSRESR
jgi:ceramide glucosyltransferase